MCVCVCVCVCVRACVCVCVYQINHTHLHSIKPVIWLDALTAVSIVSLRLINYMVLEEYRVFLQILILEAGPNLREEGQEKKK